MLLAFAAPLALVRPQYSLWWLVADMAWCLALAVDIWRCAGEDPGLLGMQRELPAAFSVGRTLPVLYRWANKRTRPIILVVRERFPSALGYRGSPERTLTIRAGEVAHETHAVTGEARGKLAVGDAWLRISSPWGLAWVQERRPTPFGLTVFPALTSVALRAMPTQLQRRREAGLRNVRRLGEGRTFESLRDWVPGDDTRVIDWKATAKRGKPMARQYEDERRQHLLIVIDAGRMLTAQSDGRPRLEAVIDAALQLAYAAIEYDDNVGLLVFADTIQHYVPPARGQRVLRQILEALATTEGRLVEPDYPAAFTYLAAKNRRRALTVVFTDVIDRTASDAMVAMVGTLRPRHLPLAVALRIPELERLATARTGSVRAAYERAAAEELLQSRELALSDMRTRGVLVLDVPPADAAKAVVDRYTQLKRRAAI